MIELKASHLITDIEGTTTDIGFVHRVLFPYSLRHMAEFVASHAQESDVREQLDAVAKRTGANPENLNKLTNHLEQWIDEDRKYTPLKTLQGMIWRQGYEQGDFKGHVYGDAYRQLQQWYDAGVRLYVFSSGSTEAQKLLFGHSEHGDMTSLFADYFDTRTGAKQASESYQQIVEQIEANPSDCVFLSDSAEELDAAAEAGLQTVQIDRSEVLTEGEHPIAYSFDDITIQN